MNKSAILAALASLLFAAPVLAIDKERLFLDQNHLTQRMATMAHNGAVLPHESWITNQGGSSGKACDSGPTIPANVMTQVSSDNDTSNGNPGTWQSNGNGFVTLLNMGTKAALCTADEFYGDQTQEGAVLTNYYHIMPVQWKNILPLTGEQIGWHLLDTIPLLADHTNDAMAYWIYITCSQPVSCTLNGYDTAEFGQ